MSNLIDITVTVQGGGHDPKTYEHKTWGGSFTALENISRKFARRYCEDVGVDARFAPFCNVTVEPASDW